MKKRGNENKILPITIVLVVLAVIIVSVFIFVSKQKELDLEPSSISEQCKFACDTNQKISFCDVKRQLTDGSKETCYELSKQNKLNVEPCPGISCVKETLSSRCVSDLGSVWKTPTSEGNCPAEENKFVRKRTPSDNPPIEGQICCYYYE